MTAYDAFISYACVDASWVHALADNLERLEVHVWLDAYEVQAGQVLVPELERGLSHSDCGLVVFSAASVTRPWVQEEYAAIMTRVVDGKMRFIPVLREDVALPPYCSIRRPTQSDSDSSGLAGACIRRSPDATRDRMSR